MIGLDEQGDQFGGAVPYNNIFRLAAGILGDALPKLFLFPVRIDSDGVQVPGERISEFAGNAQRIDIGRKTDNFFFFYVIDLLDFLQVASVKMVFVL